MRAAQLARGAGLVWFALIEVATFFARDASSQPAPPPPPPPPCPPNYCSGHGSCDSSGGSPVCSCNSGWGGSRCSDCTNPCRGVAPTQHASACPGSKCLGDACSVSCTEGYNGAGSGHYTCSEDGSWTGGSLTCAPVRCAAGAIPGVAHATGCAEGQYGGASCSISCEAGYQGSGSGRYTCDKTGHWTGGNLVCTGKPCTGAPAASGDLHSTEDATVPGHFPSKLTFSCAHPNEQVAGDTIWECSNTTLAYEPVTKPGTRAQDVKCTACPPIDHCPAEQLRCPIHFEPPNCCQSFCWKWSIRCQAVTDKSCNLCEPGYADGAPTACNPQQCPTIPLSEGMQSVTYKVNGQVVASAPLFSGSASQPTAVAEFRCASQYILTNSKSEYVAADSAQAVWACGVSADGKVPEWKAWDGHSFVPGIVDLPRCVPTCGANPCSSAATAAVAAQPHFSKCYDNGGKQKFRCTCKMGWQGERCDTDIDECTHTVYSENCAAKCEERSECPIEQGKLPPDCTPTGFALEVGRCDQPYWVDKDHPNQPSGCDYDGDSGLLLTACHNVNGSWSCGACLENPSCCKPSAANIRAVGQTPWHESSSYVLCDVQSSGNSGACADVQWEQAGCTGSASAQESSAALRGLPRLQILSV